MHPVCAARVLNATVGVGAIPAFLTVPPVPRMPDITRCASRGLVVRVSMPTIISEDLDASTEPIFKAVTASVWSNFLRIPEDPNSMYHH